MMNKMTIATVLTAFVTHFSPVLAEDVAATWDNSYGGADKSYDANLLEMRAEIAPKFQVMTFQDAQTGKSMEYNLFVPENYDASESYPLVLFMADASTVGKGVAAPLMQGYGGIIWASDEEQMKHPSFVLVPSYAGPQPTVNDNWQTSDEVDMTLRLLEEVTNSYNVDADRMYTTGQSMGGMMSFYFDATYPDLFAASMFVGSQWDVSVLEPLAKEKFLYIVSAGDEKASGGMAQLGSMLTDDGVTYGQAAFSAKLPESEQDAEVAKLLDEGYDINFIQFDAHSVLPDPNADSGPGGDHMYSFDYAYQLTPARDWLFEQVKE